MIDESKYIAKGPIYKFTNTKWAKEILTERTLKFTNPKCFNDPFDCNPAILKFTKTEESYKELIDSLKLVVGSRFEKRKLLNELFSSSEEFNELYEGVVNDKINRTRVTCFSKMFESNLMWSHYGDEHKGVCLEFNSSLKSTDIFENIEVDMITNVNYEGTDYIDYNINKREAIIELFSRKSNDWKYEEEVRIILINKNEIQKFKENFLTGVTFGCRIDSKEKEEILKIINDLNYNIRVKEAIKGDFKLDFKTLK